MNSFRPAKVLRDGDPGAENVLRVVPATAEFLKIGKATIGYWNRPRRVRRKSYLGSVQRLSEAFTVLTDRHGGPVDTDDGESYLEALAHLVAWNERTRAAMKRIEPERQSIVDQVISTCSAWLVMVDRAAVVRAAHEAADEPKKYTADQFAKAWAITFAERIRLGLRSIGCCDMSKAKRKEASASIKKEKDRMRASEKRRASGARPRDTSDTEFCRLHGLPYRTFKRRKAAGRLEEYLAEVGYLHEWPEFVANIPMVPVSATKKGQCRKWPSAGASIGAGRGHQAPPTASDPVIDFNLTDDEFVHLLDQAERDRQRAASRAAAASSTAFRIYIFERIARQVAANQKAA